MKITSLILATAAFITLSQAVQALSPETTADPCAKCLMSNAHLAGTGTYSAQTPAFLEQLIDVGGLCHSKCSQ